MLSEHQNFGCREWGGRGQRERERQTDRQTDIREFQERKYCTFEKFSKYMIACMRQVPWDNLRQVSWGHNGSTSQKAFSLIKGLVAIPCDKARKTGIMGMMTASINSTENICAPNITEKDLIPIWGMQGNFPCEAWTRLYSLLASAGLLSLCKGCERNEVADPPTGITQVLSDTLLATDYRLVKLPDVEK